MRSAGTITLPLLILASCSSVPVAEPTATQAGQDSAQPTSVTEATTQDDDSLDGAAQDDQAGPPRGAPADRRDALGGSHQPQGERAPQGRRS